MRVYASDADGTIAISGELADDQPRSNWGVPLGTRLKLYADIKGPDDCWLWTGGKTTTGYGKVAAGKGRSRSAHRIMYEELRGPVPSGLVLDHLCRNIVCVNPNHMEVVTQKENLYRGNGFTGRAVRQTHCPAGHILFGENLVRSEQSRKCRVCANKRNRERYHRRKGMR